MPDTTIEAPLGATYMGEGRCRFLVWAPRARAVDVHVVAPREHNMGLENTGGGYFRGIAVDVKPGSRYFYRLFPDDPSKGAPVERPDPASRSQPEGVHGPSQVMVPDFCWHDNAWCGLPLAHYIIYELHTGAYSPEGTFDAVIEYLDELKETGITAVELMPVAQFPGTRNWGYDGVLPFAVQNSYGGPDGLKRLVDACHRRDLAVVLDVVYNHLGPEGNYLRDFGPYFTDFYHTPWGEAVNFDGAGSDEVRRFFIENALFWVREFRIDALRLDAVHAILDFSARPFLEELGLAVHQAAEKANRRIYLIAESALNDTRVIRSRELGGFGLDAQWNDDFHHSLHALLTGEKGGYYRDFGRLADLAKSLGEGYVYDGRFSAFRGRRHGNSSRNIPARQFTVFSQNHDQIGNRMKGERLSTLVDYEKLKLAAGLVLLSPFIPLLFMGEEYGETAPFQYFVDHSDPDLLQAVAKGRKKEFKAFEWQEEIPEPHRKETFLRAGLDHALKEKEPHRTLHAYYRELMRLRKEIPALFHLSKKQMRVGMDEDRLLLWMERRHGQSRVLVLFHFSAAHAALSVHLPAGRWRKRLDSADTAWSGPGSAVPGEIESSGRIILDLSPHSFVLFEKH